VLDPIAEGAALGLSADVALEIWAHVCRVATDRDGQRDDWSKRPLTAKQEDYALADVAHLMALAAGLTRRLAAAGRTEWAREEFAALASLPPAEKRTGPDEFRRIKGSARLPRL